MIGRFFFIQQAQAIQGVNRLETFEFLHATFGEFLIARLIVQLLVDITMREAAGRTGLRASPPHDDLVYSLLSFAPLSGQGSTVMAFVGELLMSADPRIREWLLRAFRFSTMRTDAPVDAYMPVHLPHAQRMVRYGLNLVLLMASQDHVTASELYPDDSDPAGQLGRLVHGWQATLSRSAWQSLVDILSVEHLWTDGKRDMRICDIPSPDPGLVDVYWASGEAPDAITSETNGASVFTTSISGMSSKAHLLRGDIGEELLRHTLEPLMDRFSFALEFFVVHQDGKAESLARSLLRTWMTSVFSDSCESRTEAYNCLTEAVLGLSADPSQSRTQAAIVLDIVLEMLIRDARSLRREDIARWLSRIEKSDVFEQYHHSFAVRDLQRIVGLPNGDSIDST
jgi:hypothetical protein